MASLMYLLLNKSRIKQYIVGIIKTSEIIEHTKAPLNCFSLFALENLKYRTVAQFRSIAIVDNQKAKTEILSSFISCSDKRSM